MATPDRPPTRLERWKGRYDLVSDIFTPQRLGLALAVVLVAVVGAVGGPGLVEAVEAEVPVVEPGTKVAAAPFEVTIRKARHGAELKPVAYRADGVRYLFVVADVTVTGREPVDAEAVRAALTLDAERLRAIPSRREPGVTRREPPQAHRTSDSLRAATLQPGIDYELVFTWQQDATVPVPAQVTATVHGHTWRESMLDGSHGWRDPAAVALVTVPVEPLREEQ